jgi:UDP-GlcNAc3NAcA epimerase
MRKIISVIGARPQFIKHAPVSIALSQRFQSLSIHTGQHFDENMSRVFFDELKIARPDFFLDLPKGASHGKQTGIMLEQVEEILLREKPDAVLLYGDTNSTIAGALAAAKLNIPIIHIEAGLRSFNREMPEEINRIVTDHLSSLLFAPTQTAVDHLKNEGIVKGVYMTGDVMCDSLEMMKPFLEKKSSGKYYFTKLNRTYNKEDKERLVHILKVLNELHLPVIFPIHPRTSGLLRNWGIDHSSFKNIQFVDPVGYRDCLSYQAWSDCVITDSGGIQKEAYMLKKQCITVRKETEWVETLEDGCNTLVYNDLGDIKKVLEMKNTLTFKNLYGDGRAAEKIASVIETHLAGN